MNRIFLALAVALACAAADAPKPEIDSATAAEYWQAAAHATAAQSDFNRSLTDAQKQLMAWRDKYAQQAQAAADKATKQCEAAHKKLNAETFTCEETPKK